MADSSLQESISKSENLSLAMSAPVSDAMTALLNEGRTNAYSISGKVDISDPRKVEMETNLRIDDSVYPTQELHGIASTNVDLSRADSAVVKASSAVAFLNEKGEAAGFASITSTADGKTGISAKQFRNSDAEDKTSFDGSAKQVLELDQNVYKTSTVEMMIDGAGKPHAAIELSTAAADGSRSASELYLFKDGLSSDQLTMPENQKPENMTGVIQTHLVGDGNQRDFDVQIRSPHTLEFPSLYFSLNR